MQKQLPFMTDEDFVRLTRQEKKILEMLKQGPQTNVELMMGSGTRNFTARISNLRRCGHQIKCLRGKQGVNTYILA